VVATRSSAACAGGWAVTTSVCWISTLSRVAAALRPGGRFAWNAFAFDHHIAARLDGTRPGRAVPHTLRYAVADNRIDTLGDDGTTSSLWWATRNE
jgi:hypothetical protein